MSDSTPADQWWRRAVFYEITIHAFYDSNDDGIGDLALSGVSDSTVGQCRARRRRRSVF